jgi:hypothetical protein
MRKQVVCEQNRLGALEMRVSGQVGIAGGNGPIQENLLQGEDPFGEINHRRSRVEPQVCCNLIVAGSTCVDFRPRVADQFGEAPLDRRVDVLVSWSELEDPSGKFVLNLIQS